ncbi:hypothetical protein J2Z44_000713 [Clostridium punense]|uniref:Tail specific protease domain-containing protein n=1 Tax=Clostridium punense TaxID=1054297 RepID=A0ABS4K2M1_9CLOT|nr:hypothetical protein [Clostridium punense]MBP2020929.1 hypothetical protein [Clostridium punense]
MEKKFKLYILLGFLAVMLLLGISFTTDLNYSDNKGLNYGQKKKDAEYLINVLEEVYPYYKLEKDTGNIESRRKIINSISKTKTDEEFLEAISNFLGKLREGVAQIYPSQLNERDIILFDEKQATDKMDCIAKSYEGQKKWREMINGLDGYKEYIMPQIYANYFEGDYYISGTQNPDIYPGDIIIKIEGMSVEEYMAKYFGNNLYRVGVRIKDSKRNKQAYYGVSIYLKDKSSKVKVVVVDKDGKEKEVEVGAYEEDKPWLFTETSSEATVYDESKGRECFNTLEGGKVVALNFNREFIVSNKENWEKIYKTIDNSEYLILDLRGFVVGDFLKQIIDYISFEEIDISKYSIMKKNQYNDRVIKELENQYAAVFQDKFSIKNKIIDEKFPPSDYFRSVVNEGTVGGKGKYKGKVIIFTNIFSPYSIDLSILKLLNSNESVMFIANNDIVVDENYYSEFIPKIILPNSNLALIVQNAWIVDSQGEATTKQSMKPDYLIEEDKELYVSVLRGEVQPFFYENYRKYTNKDEYYKKFIQEVLIKKR